MKKNHKYLFLLLILFILPGCQKVFEPEGMDFGKKLMVINGILDDLSEYMVVTVFYASPFGKTDNLPVEATVNLLDNLGISYPINAIVGKKGYYKIRLFDIELVDTRSYSISVETTDGKKYQSKPQFFPGKIEITDMNAKIGENTINFTNSLGEVTTTSIPGLFISETTRSSDKNKKYMRYDNTAIYQSLYIVVIADSIPDYYYCVDLIKLDNVPNIQSTLLGSVGHVIENKNVGFVNYEVDYSTEKGDTSARFPVGWVLMSDVYSLSEDTYNYYQKMETQLSANDKIFDPQPSQIIGNIYCITEPDEIVLGNFEVSRHVKKFYAFMWSRGDDNYQKKYLETYNPPIAPRCDTAPKFDIVEFK